MKKNLIILVLIHISIITTGAKIDSLQNALNNTNKPELQIDLMIKIGSEFFKTSPDSAIHYYAKALKIAKDIDDNWHIGILLKEIGIVHKHYGNYEKAKNNINKAIKIFRKNGMKQKLGLIYNNLANIYSNQGNYAKSITIYKKAININQSSNNLKAVGECFNNLGIAYKRMGLYDSALTYYQRAIKIFDSIDYALGIAACSNSIGNIHKKLKNYDKSLTYFYTTLDQVKKINYKKGLPIGYSNIGDIYLIKKQYDSALILYNKAYKIDKETNNKNGVYHYYNNIGLVYEKKSMYNPAIKKFEKALRIAKELNDSSKIGIVHKNIANNYFYIALHTNNTSDRNKYLNRAIYHIKYSLKIAESINALNLMYIANEYLYLYYKKLNHYKKAFTYAERYINLHDSILNKEKTRALQEMETRYQTQKKEQKIKLLNKEKALQQARIKRQKLVNVATIIGLLLVVTLIIAIYRRYKEKLKANMLLQEKNTQINQQKEEITTQRDEIEAQRDSLQEQKQQLEKINKETTQSITYARLIQGAALPTQSFLDKIVPERFILFIPQNIVGGDFYWVTQKNDTTIVAAADCTGHGVPGGFMSMLGMSLLNEIVNKEGILQPAEILDKLRQNIINALHQQKVAGSVRDGMDISLIAINYNQQTLTYAGANRPAFFLKKRSRESEIPERAVANDTHMLIEASADKMPISISHKMKNFTQKQYHLEETGIIYMASDGFADQFGGQKQKKYLRKNLKKLLLRISTKPMHEQYQILENEFRQWKGNNPQYDDVLVMGIKLSIPS